MHSAAKNPDSFSILLSDEAYFSLTEISSLKVKRHIVAILELLETTPYLGREYQPLYDAAKPAIPCRVFYCEYLGIYYYVSEQAKTVTVVAIEDQRRDSMNRFSTHVQL